MLAPVAKKVIGVEIIPEAVEAAKINAGINGLDNCEFIADDVLNALDNIKDKPDFIVLIPALLQHNQISCKTCRLAGNIHH